MFADVTFHTDVSENTLVIPSQAISSSNGVQSVYVVEDGTARYVEITTGLAGNGVTEVLSGLTEGQQLVTVGQAYLADGDPVTIDSGEDAPAEDAPAGDVPAEDAPETQPPASGEAAGEA